MTAYPHRYGDTDRAVEHYATACVASAKVLRSEGLPDRAADLEAAAEHARAHLDQPDYRDQPVDRSTLDRGAPDLSDPDLFDEDGQVPRWWR